MAFNETWLPDEVADGTKYVVEACGQDKSGAVLIQRYVEFPDGNVIMLSQSKTTPCLPKHKQVGITSALLPRQKLKHRGAGVLFSVSSPKLEDSGLPNAVPMKSAVAAE
jgi:hypothetical protein